ncbi:MAG: hypothetical protein IAI50_13220 [Candidatus Eremiobacteraeota bacterium]|nr:hypothetical protein [Candidatus Eremiobacteraeota bacterium]
MADRAKTGNVLLDAWIDALTPRTPTKETASSFSWERMFLGNSEALPVGAFAGGLDATARVTELWADLTQRSLGVVAALGDTANAGDPLGKALEQSFGVVGDVGGSVAEGPALLAEATKAFGVLCAAREAYRVFMLAVWQRAFEEVTREAVRRAGEGTPIVSPAHWLSLSNEVADRVFVEAFNSQAYLDVQQRLSSALADQRLSELKFVEIFARFGHFPTRRALDEVSQEVNELRRRVRKLERANRGASSKSRRKAKAVDDA